MLLSKIILIIYLSILPFLGKNLETGETIFFYFPPLVVCLLFLIKNKQPTKHLPIWPQVILIIFFLISTIFSQNPGTSVNFFFIFLNVILTLNLSLNLISPKEFSWLIIGSSAIYSFLFLFSKASLITLPLNLVGDDFIPLKWGHSYISDLTVLSIPFILNILNKKNSKLIIPLTIFITSSLFLTQSRAALIALILGLVIFKPSNNIQKKIKLFLYASITISFLYIFILTVENKLPHKTLFGNRLEYTQQSVKAFIDHPFVGYGPGTFSNISSKYQKDNSSKTAYSHSFILTNLSENGLFFTVFFLILISLAIIKTSNTNNLFFATSAIALSSAITDSTWDSPGIYILSLYIIFYSLTNTKPKDTRFIKSFLLIMGLFIFICTFLFEISYMYFLRQDYPKSIAIYPFNLDARLANIEDKKTLDSTLGLFPNEARLYEQLIQNIPLPTSEPYYYKLFELSPKENSNKYLQLAKHYQNTNNKKLDELLYLITKNFDNNYFEYNNVTDISKVFYTQAINIYRDTPQKAIDFLKEITILQPDNNNFQIELGNAYWHNNQKNEAIRQLNYICEKNKDPARLCQTYLMGHIYSDFNLPGFL